jgi:hypothetical protein
MNQRQNVKQVVKIILGDLKPKKKRKRKKKKSVFKPKSALEVASNPQPYQIPLYYPPFPSPLPKTKFDNGLKIQNALRNYTAVSKAEINRLRGDLTAYRQEAQTAFKQNVAFPRATINVGDDNITGTDITLKGLESEVSTETPISAHDPDSDFEPSQSGTQPPSPITSPLTSPTDVSDFPESEDEPTTRSVRFDFAPRATSSQRRERRANKSMKEIKIEMKRAGVRNYSGLNQQELYDLAGQVGIDISRQTIAL